LSTIIILSSNEPHAVIFLSRKYFRRLVKIMPIYKEANWMNLSKRIMEFPFKLSRPMVKHSKAFGCDS